MNNSEILIYQNSEGSIKIDVRLEEESVWLTQDQMANLFGKAKSTINEHIKNVYDENELVETLTMKKFGNSEFQQKTTNYCNLDVIISISYRVKSPQGTQFRIWCNRKIAIHNFRKIRIHQSLKEIEEDIKKMNPSR